MHPLPKTRLDHSRAIHAIAQELELPGSVAGYNAHHLLHRLSVNVFKYSGWDGMSAADLRAVYKFLTEYKRLPADKKEIKSYYPEG